MVWNKQGKTKPKHPEKIFCKCHFFTTNSTYTDLASTLGLRHRGRRLKEENIWSSGRRWEGNRKMHLTVGVSVDSVLLDQHTIQWPVLKNTEVKFSDTKWVVWVWLMYCHCFLLPRWSMACFVTYCEILFCFLWNSLNICLLLPFRHNAECVGHEHKIEGVTYYIIFFIAWFFHISNILKQRKYFVILVTCCQINVFIFCVFISYLWLAMQLAAEGNCWRRLKIFPPFRTR
jgi:hypothetical protein